MAGLYLRSNSVVEDLSHTWLLRLIPNEQTTTSGGLQKGKALRTKRKTEQTLLHTHTHTCMYKYMGKTRPRPLNDKALPVWNNAHITTHHHHSAKRKFSVAPILSSRSCFRAKAKSFSKNHFQTDKILYCMTTQTALCRDRGPLWHLLSFWANCWETQTMFMVQSRGK